MTRRTRGLLWGGLLMLAAVAVQAVIVAADPVAPWSQALDDAWRGAIGVGSDSDAHTGPLPMFFQHLGQLPGFVATFILLPIVLAVIGRWRSAVFIVTVQLVAPGVVSQLLKNLVNRPRPAADEAAGLFGPLFSVDHGSFPSGHSVSAAALAVMILALIPPWRRGLRILWAVVGAAVMIGMVWQRTLINAHWLSDTIAGLLVGAGVVLVLWWAFQPWLRSDHGRRPWFLPASASASVPERRKVIA